MSFDSVSYLLFLPLIAVLHRLCPHRWRWTVLLAASFVFYARWNLPLAALLFAVIAATWAAGLALERAARPAARRGILCLALAVCIGLLGYFKYFNFLAGTFAALSGGTWTARDSVLPVGVSFYTFQAMSYAIDVFRRTLPAERHFGYYALYISFFPQLVAGPIERAGDLLPQLRRERRITREDLRAGVRLLLSGYFRKIVIADFCAVFVNAAYAAENPDGSAVFLGTLLFAFQIYCDFAGYSEIAQGSARLLGIRLMDNFDRPFLSQSIREFWRRWHISLGRWLADYVYIPLGGSRRGAGRQLLATLAVFALSGLWHGADWTFVVWGLFHGMLVILEILLSRAGVPAPRAKAGKAARAAATFALVTFSWIFFRATSLAQAAELISRLFSPWDVRGGLAALGVGRTEALALAFAIGQCPLLSRLRGEGERARDMVYVYLLLAIAVGWLLRLQQNGANAFIYFQF